MVRCCGGVCNLSTVKQIGNSRIEQRFLITVLWLCQRLAISPSGPGRREVWLEKKKQIGSDRACPCPWATASPLSPHNTPWPIHWLPFSMTVVQSSSTFETLRRPTEASSTRVLRAFPICIASEHAFPELNRLALEDHLALLSRS